MKHVLAAALTTVFAGSSFGFATARPLETRALSLGSLWSATRTQAFPMPGATDLGALAAATPLHIAVGLHGNMAAANALMSHLYTKGDPLYRKFLTPAQFTARFAPTSTQANAVAAYLSAAGMRNVTITPNHILVTADADVAEVSSAFDTSIHAFNLNGRPAFANVKPALVPAQFAGTIDSVLGLSSRKNRTFVQQAPLSVRQHLVRTGRVSAARMHRDTAANIPTYCSDTSYAATLLPGALLGELGVTVPTLPSTGTLPLPFCYPASFAPIAYRTAYNDQANPTANKTVVADFVESLPSGPKGSGALSDVVNDLYQMEYTDGLPQTPASIVQVGSDVSSDTSGQIEWDLDSQAAVGIGGGVKSYVFYNAGDISQDGTAEMFSRFATDDYAQVGNASFGDCEAEYAATGGLATTDLILAEVVLQGQTIFASAGDSGSFCGTLNGVDAGLPDTIYPSASPYAVSVGGTSILVSSTTGDYYSEISWVNGGGGFAYLESQSPWQSNLIGNLGGLDVGVTAGPRMVPDMAMEGDEYTGMDVIASGTTIPSIGGTSLSAPLAEGVYARLQSRHGNLLGNAGPILYQTYYAGGGGIASTTAPTSIAPPEIAGFRDEILGADGLYTALPGYDLNTGMGSFDIDKTFVLFGS